MSLCRITGKAKGLPRAHYFPLLAPISPADARRYCRITGKAYGLPLHHYIPVILTTYSNLSKCKVTNSADFALHHFAPDFNYGKRKHIILADYLYVFPVFDESNVQQKDLIELLNSKVVQCDEHRFVYPVAERKCSLVFSAKLEAAVRNGDVRDVMLAKNKESVLLKMKQGKNVSLELQDYNEGSLDDENWFEGEGPREEVILEMEMEEHDRRQRYMKRKQNLMHMANIFESKEHNDDEELSRPQLVPGQVINTEDGHDVNTEDEQLLINEDVILIPGEIVQTDQGPRFVAPDLIDDEDDEHSFSVQSFLVAPEELTLLQPNHTCTTLPYSNGDLSIDSNMLKQLSEAGMTNGHQNEVSPVDIALQSIKDNETVKQFAEKFGIYNAEQTEVLKKLFEEIKSIVSFVQEKIGNEVLTSALHMNGNGTVNGNGISNGNGHINGNGCVNGNGHTNGNHYKHTKQTEEDMKTQMVNLLSTTILECIYTSQINSGKMTKPKQQPQHHNHQNHNSSLYEIISQTLADKLEFDFAEEDSNYNNYTNIVDCIEKILASPAALKEIHHKVDEMIGQAMRVNKVNLIKSTISKNCYNEAEILNNICIILHAENEHEMLETVRLLSEQEPKILHRIVSELRAHADKLNDEMVINEILKKSIISAVKQSCDNEIEQIISMSGSSMVANETSEILNEHVMETIALAKALGLADVVHNLWNAVQSCADVGKKLLRDEKCMELIQHVVVMRKLAKNNAEFKEALEMLRRDPYSARKDANMCKLFRCSGICLINPVDKTKLTGSHEVPISLFCSDNQLAMQDFFLRRQTKSRGAFLIVKEGLQCVVPREASRDVLTGKCAYTVLDENGIRDFEPLHVFSALRLHFPLSTHRFSMYSCDDDILIGNGDKINGHSNGLGKPNGNDKHDQSDLDTVKIRDFNGNTDEYKQRSFCENGLIQKQVF